MGRGVKRFFNWVTLFFAGLTLATGGLVLGVASGAVTPPFLAPTTTTAGLPPAATVTAAPSVTPTRAATAAAVAQVTDPAPAPVIATETTAPTHTPSVVPTHTASPEPSAPPASATLSPMPTFAPTRTPLAPLPTGSPTPVPSWTPAPLASPTSTPTPPLPTPVPTHTRAPYPFVVQPGTPRVRDNYLNPAGCEWQGLGGSTITNQGEHLPGIEVRIWSEEGREWTITSGDAPLYGESGWEVQLGDEPTPARFRVSLWQDGQQVSPVVDVLLRGDCQTNLGQINFVRIRPH